MFRKHLFKQNMILVRDLELEMKIMPNLMSLALLLWRKFHYGLHYVVAIRNRVILIIAFKRGGKRFSFELRVSTVPSGLTKIFIFTSHVHHENEIFLAKSMTAVIMPKLL